MKRIIALIILLFISCISLSLVGCIQFSSDEIEYIEGYGTIYMVSLKSDIIELYIEDSIYESRKEAEEIFEKFENNYSLLKHIFGLDTKISIYIVEDNNIFYSSHGSFFDGKMYCSLDIIEEDEYLPYFTALYLKTTEPWKYYGACEYVFNRNIYDKDLLKTYYSDDGNLHTLSLFAAYFNRGFSNDETIRFSKMTSASLSKFIIDSYGMDKFLKADLDDYRQEWLEALGVNRKFDIEYDVSWIYGAEYVHKKTQYPLIIKTGGRKYNLDLISSEAGYEQYGFDTPRLVFEALSDNVTKVKNVIDHIEEKIPAIFPRIIEKYDNVEYFISENEHMTSADVEENKVYLNDIGEFVHETVHVIASNKEHYEGAWLAEGIAEYFSRYIVSSDTKFDKRLFESLYEDIDNNTTLYEFREQCKNYYIACGGSLQSYEEFDRSLFEKSIGYITLKEPLYKSVSGFAFGTLSISEQTNRPIGTYIGNDMTYPEAYLFTSYLIETYGEQTVMAILFEATYDFEKSVGKSYATVFSDFINSLS